MNFRLTQAAALALVLLAPPAAAHHSATMYDPQKTVTVNGVVKSFEWTNPHVVLRVVANPEEGTPPKTWDVLFTSPGNLTRVGWSKKTFQEGDRLKVTLHPMRNGDPGGSFERAVFLDTGKEIAGANTSDTNSTPNLQ